MNVLDAARRIGNMDFKKQPDCSCCCPFCGSFLYPSDPADQGPHYSDCPWTMLPQIVAALEAAQAVVSVGTIGPTGAQSECWFCSARYRHSVGEPWAHWHDHNPGCEWAALKTAFNTQDETVNASALP